MAPLVDLTREPERDGGSHKRPLHVRLAQASSKRRALGRAERANAKACAAEAAAAAAPVGTTGKRAREEPTAAEPSSAELRILAMRRRVRDRINAGASTAAVGRGSDWGG